MPSSRIHGGPDAAGRARYDFSTNSNPCGPCPAALAAVQQADATAYPDPAYTAVRAALAAYHAVAPGRIVIAGSASEFIYRFTAWVAQPYWASEERLGAPQVTVPRHGYGDYASAAQAWGLTPVSSIDDSLLVWCCEPSSPLGTAQPEWPSWIVQSPYLPDLPDGMEPVEIEILRTAPVVWDCAYAPLRLSGSPYLTGQQRDRLWQLYSPNKALGLTGVRGAYAIAPLGMHGAVAELERMAPSWVLGVHGLALLHAWVQPEAQAWLDRCLPTLRQWKARQVELLTAQGWQCLPSEANFFTARQPHAQHPLDYAALRAQGIQLRDCTSFGLPGHVRLGVLQPEAQDALVAALHRLGGGGFLRVGD